MGIARIVICLCITPQLSLAELGALDCAGSNPEWQLTIAGEQAEFAFADRASKLDIPQRSTAEGANWPVAMTIVGPRDSAIVLLDQKACGTEDIAAHVMTQRGQTPILLTGCCVADP